MEVFFTQISNYAQASHHFIRAMAQVQAAPPIMTYITAERAVLFCMVCGFVSLLRQLLRVVTLGVFAKIENASLTGVYSLILTIIIIMQSK